MGRLGRDPALFDHVQGDGAELILERTRYARCHRCGAAWHARMLECPYCCAADHSQLITLAPQDGEAPGSIEACRACARYLKVFTVLQGCAPASVYVEDLATVDDGKDDRAVEVLVATLAEDAETLQALTDRGAVLAGPRL